jgi:hypothetical protein
MANSINVDLLDANGEKCLIVIKNGKGTGVTFGRVSGYSRTKDSIRYRVFRSRIPRLQHQGRLAYFLLLDNALNLQETTNWILEGEAALGVRVHPEGEVGGRNLVSWI